VELRQKSHAAAIRALDTEVEAISDRLKNLEGRVPHFSRCLREVGICGDILPILSKCAVEFYSRQRMNMGASLGLS
jgi:hypothetical protein